MDKLKLSVIVLSYNQEKYIYQTIDSILSQEHEYSYEIIICDDASTDSTPNIIKIYANTNKNIKPILRQTNLGVVKNFYDAISRCEGEYIMVCGGDDYYLPFKIRNQIDYLEKHINVGLVYSDIKMITADNNYIGIKKASDHLSVEELLSNYNVPASTMAIRVKDFRRFINEVRPLQKNWLMEDLPIAIWFKINNKAAYIPLISVAYRVIDSSLSHPTSVEKRFRFEKSVFDIFSFFQSLYPDKIRYSFIVLLHLRRLCNYQDVINYNKKYCFNMISRLDKKENFYIRVSLYLRIRYKLINLFYRCINRVNRR